MEIKELEREVALGGLLAQSLIHRLKGHVNGGDDREAGLLQLDLSARILQVVTRAHVPAQLVNRVDELLAIKIAHHIER